MARSNDIMTLYQHHVTAKQHNKHITNCINRWFKLPDKIRRRSARNYWKISV